MQEKEEEENLRKIIHISYINKFYISIILNKYIECNRNKRNFKMTFNIENYKN